MAKEPKSYNKEALAAELAIAQNMSKARAGRVLDKVFGIIEDTVANGGKVSYPGFGTFSSRTREAHIARNPATGEPVEVPERMHPAFKAANGFKNLLRGDEDAVEDDDADNETDAEPADEKPATDPAPESEPEPAEESAAPTEVEATPAEDDDPADGEPNLFD